MAYGGMPRRPFQIVSNPIRPPIYRRTFAKARVTRKNDPRENPKLFAKTVGEWNEFFLGDRMEVIPPSPVRYNEFTVNK